MDIVTQSRNIGKTERQKTLAAMVHAQEPVPAAEISTEVGVNKQKQQVIPEMPLEAFLQHNGWTKSAGQRRRKPQKGRNKKQARKITRTHR